MVLDQEALEEDFTTNTLALRADLANADVSMPLILHWHRWRGNGLSLAGEEAI